MNAQRLAQNFFGTVRVEAIVEEILVVVIALSIAGFVAVALGFPIVLRFHRRLILLCILASIVCLPFGAATGHLAAGAIAQTTIAWALVVFLAVESRLMIPRWYKNAENPLVLAPPFIGRWRAVVGGPFPSQNHHLAVADQVYAYDFIREDGDTWGSAILAPIAGKVVKSRDNMPDHPSHQKSTKERLRPFGNFVAIDSGRGFVILAHLQRESVCVAPGMEVLPGDVIGRCGNSGRTTSSHLHIHAQNRADEAPGLARAVPIAFIDQMRGQCLLEADDVLTNVVPLAAVGKPPLKTLSPRKGVLHIIPARRCLAAE